MRAQHGDGADQDDELPEPPQTWRLFPGSTHVDLQSRLRRRREAERAACAPPPFHPIRRRLRAKFQIPFVAALRVIEKRPPADTGDPESPIGAPTARRSAIACANPKLGGWSAFTFAHSARPVEDRPGHAMSILRHLNPLEPVIWGACFRSLATPIAACPFHRLVTPAILLACLRQCESIQHSR